MSKRKGWHPLVTLTIIGLLPFNAWAVVAFVEAYTLSDSTPGNHITAAFRWALDTNPDLTLVVFTLWVLAWTLPAAVILGHIFHGWGGRDARPRELGGDD